MKLCTSRFRGYVVGVAADGGNEAGSLAGLGRCALAVGRTAEAETGLRQALEVFQRIGAGEATGVTAELQAFDQATAADM